MTAVFGGFIVTRKGVTRLNCLEGGTPVVVNPSGGVRVCSWGGLFIWGVSESLSCEALPLWRSGDACWNRVRLLRVVLESW